jgi:hypothetical protein
MLTRRLAKRRHFRIDAQLARNVPKALACSLAMGIALRLGAHYLAGPLAGHLLAKAASLTLLVAGGLALFFGLALLTGTVSAAELRRWARRAA